MSSSVQGSKRETRECPLRADSVEKVFFGRRTKILKTADAFRARRREGPHHFIQKRPPVFVSAVEGFVAVAASKNRLLRDFRGCSIFDFFNTVGHCRKSASFMRSSSATASNEAGIGDRARAKGDCWQLLKT